MHPEYGRGRRGCVSSPSWGYDVTTPSTYSRFDLKSFLINAAGLCVLALSLSAEMTAQAMLPFMNAGPDSNFSAVDFTQMFLDNTTKEQKRNAEIKAQRQHMVDAGLVSALDLDASGKALDEYNRAASLLKQQNSKEAIVHLQKAIAAYPKFVLAYNALGLAYIDQDDNRAKSEFETAAKLDAKYPGSFFNLGTLALSQKDFPDADADLSKAAALSPNNAKILAALAFAESGDHHYPETLQTVDRVHALDHRGLANVHYIAAAAAMALNNDAVMERQLNLFLSEDPTNPLAPVARQNLDALKHRRNAGQAAAIGPQQPTALGAAPAQTFPNSARLEEQLKAVGEGPESSDAAATTEAGAGMGSPTAPAPTTTRSPAGLYTLRKAVDETAVFFAVSNHGHMVDDLKLSDIKILDDNKAPETVITFLPQSKLPLRLGLLIDTSGSVQDRFLFEKHAAEKFVQRVLNGTSDLGFVAGFSGDINVTRDFVADPAELTKGIEKLENGGGTSLFDAVTFGCEKLAAYPEEGRVARVLVILSDGEDNSSHRSLKQAIEEAENSGVTVYAVSTAEDAGAKSDADKILQALAERSGGEALFPGDMPTFGHSLDKLRELIRSRYLLAYRAAGFAPNGQYRPLRIIAERDGKRMQVHVRKGYYARRAETRD
jgi:Ca-activated chloride channel homolog